MKEAILRSEDDGVVEFALDEAVDAGDVVKFGDKCVVATVSATVNERIAYYTKGIFEVATNDDDFASGDKVYFDFTNRVATKTAENNTFLGSCIEKVGDSVKVMLNR